MTEYTWALVAALIGTTVGVSLVALRQTKRLVQLKKEKARLDALAKAAELARQQKADLEKARTAAKKKPAPAAQPLLGVVAPKKTTTKKKDTK